MLRISLDHKVKATVDPIDKYNHFLWWAIDETFSWSSSYDIYWIIRSKPKKTHWICATKIFDGPLMATLIGPDYMYFSGS